MQEEIQALLNLLEHPKQQTKGKRTYYRGTLFGSEVILVFSRWGKVASATTATQLINDFEIEELIFTGVAGAISSELDIGDIVVGKQLVQHDMNASPLFPNFEIPLLNKTFFETDAVKREQLRKACQRFIENYTDSIPKDDASRLDIHQPKVFVGDIASGDQFISNFRQVNAISEQLESVVCVEMEGAAVAQVCYEYEMPFSIIRIISDKANADAPVDFPVFVEQIASKYALEVFRNYFL